MKNSSNRASIIFVSSFIILMLTITANSGFTQDSEKEQCTSLLGEPLYKSKLSPEAANSLNAKYNIALKNFRAQPGNPDTHIWLGRRLAYLGEYIKAIRVFTDGIYYFPDDPRFFRHRGHRYISCRKLDLALADFEHAAKMIEGKEDRIEPDGAPNAAGIPVSTLNSNIWYHLGLTQYLLGDFENAFRSYERCYKESDNNDKKVSSGYWLFIIGKRLEKHAYCDKLMDEIGKDMKLIENFAYHQMLMFYKSGNNPEEYGLPINEIMEDPTRAYALGMWYFLQNNEEGKSKATEIFEKIIKLPTWASFGYIAAEAELAQIK